MKELEYVNIDGLTNEQISELIYKYAPKPDTIIIIKGEVIELK